MSHLYVHIPFCAHRCGYCDFVSSSEVSLIPAYLEALNQEIGLLAKTYGDVPGIMPLKTIYIGGGTPSLLSPDQLQGLLEAIHAHFGAPSQEYTVEMNPETATEEKIQTLVRGGVNRISLGMQAVQENLLVTLERRSRYPHVVKAVGHIKAAGIPHLSLDLIYGIPGQTLEDLAQSLEAVLALDPDHVSTYALKLEPDTPMGKRELEGTLLMPSDDTAADHLDLIIDTLESRGFERYEISNFAKPGGTSKHNLSYWKGATTLGVGLGAVYFIADPSGTHSAVRYENLREFGPYFERIATNKLPIDNQEALGEDDLAFEALILGLRLKEGIDLEAYRARFGVEFEARYKKLIDKYLGLGLMKYTENARAVALTRAGMAIENALLVEMSNCHLDNEINR